MNDTSIIIPSFNGIGLLKDCIASIRSYTEEPHEIIVVDNGSTDGTTEWCRDEQIPFVFLPENRGFPYACNIGLRVASGDALLLLNNDTLVTPNWLGRLHQCLYSEEEIGIVGPMSNYASGRQQIDFPYTDLQDAVRRIHERDEESWKDTNRVVGMCFLLKREVLERVGEFDERFAPGHFEDDDYCYRAKAAGYRVMIVGNCFVFHHGSASFGKQEEATVERLIETNRNRFIEKWGFDPVSLLESEET